MRTQEAELYDDRGDVDGLVHIMPDIDIANIAKRREEGVGWLCGNFIETVTTSSTFLTGIAPDHTDTAKPPITEEEINKRCAVRAQKQVRRIVNANKFSIMWTLTMCLANSDAASQFSEPVCRIAQQNYNACRDLFKRFIRKLRKEYPGFEYLVVLELHNSEKTSEEKLNTIHFHVATKTYVKWEDMGRIWGHGVVRYDDFNRPTKERGGKVRNPGAYMSKYVGKAFDKSNRHRKRYTRSQNTINPQKLSLGEVRAILDRSSSRICHERERIFEFFSKQHNAGGIYGVRQCTYRLSN